MRTHTVWKKALNAVRLIAGIVAFMLLVFKGGDQFFGHPVNLLMALISGFVAYRLVYFTYGRMSRGLVTRRNLPDEAFCTIYTILTINPANSLLFSSLGTVIISLSRKDAFPALINDYFTTALLGTALLFGAVAIFGEIFNLIARLEVVQRSAIRFWNYMREAGNHND